jgi:two-component system, chemotaxis family, protein-glutamate methylesterase/glutaminase
MSDKVKILIIDDSALVRNALKKIFASDPHLEVIGSVSDPFYAVEIISKETPHVITLDIEMPKMDGLTFLKKLMTQHPIPVVVISTLTASGSDTCLKALELGAIEVLEKPKINTLESMEAATRQYCELVKAAAKARVKKLASVLHVEPKNTADVILKKQERTHLATTTDKVIVVGASTGGTEAIKELLTNMPHDCAGIIIVLHMPQHFTKQYAQRLNSISAIEVKEAENGDSILRGHAYIAPGGYHMLLKRSGARYFIEIKDGPLVNRHKPSVDVLFRSAAITAGANAVGVIMTGMGDDGAKGLLEMKQAGAYTIAQDEQSCVVFGMPKEAIKLGAVDKVMALTKIPDAIEYYLNKQTK